MSGWAVLYIFFKMVSVVVRPACIKLARVGSSFLLLHSWRTKSNQTQRKNSFTEAHVTSLVKEQRQLFVKEAS